MKSLDRTSSNIVRFCSGMALSAALHGLAGAQEPSRARGHGHTFPEVEPSGRLLASAQPGGGSTPEAEAVRYTCPMHPEVVSDSPGRCPHCGMKLVEQEPGARRAEGS